MKNLFESTTMHEVINADCKLKPDVTAQMGKDGRHSDGGALQCGDGYGFGQISRQAHLDRQNHRTPRSSPFDRRQSLSAKSPSG